jgi:hypothetical protein
MNMHRAEEQPDVLKAKSAEKQNVQAEYASWQAWSFVVVNQC